MSRTAGCGKEARGGGEQSAENEERGGEGDSGGEGADEKWAAGVPVPTYGIDDQTAIKVVDGAVEVVSEGHWKLFAPERQGAWQSEAGVPRDRDRSG